MLNEWSDRDPGPPRTRRRFLTLDFWLMVLFVPMTILGMIDLGRFIVRMVAYGIALLG